MLAQSTCVHLNAAARLLSLCGCSWLSLCMIDGRAIQAQETYELAAPQLGATSQATLNARELRVESSDGRVTIYRREPRFDSPGGEWIGYISGNTNQVLRWPASNSGHMQIGDIHGGDIQYRYSQMSIRAVGRLRPHVVDRPVLPPDSDSLLATQSPTSQQFLRPSQIDPPAPLRIGNLSTSDFFGKLFAASNDPQRRIDPRSLRIASYNGRNAPALLTRGMGYELGSTNNVSEASDWWVAPAGSSMVRVQTYDRGRVYAISSQSAERVTLMPLTQDPRQLWRITGVGRADNRYVLENAQYPGMCLSNIAGGRIALQPINFAPAQLWVPLVPPPAAAFQPFYRTVRQEIHANPRLPQAQLELFNSHRYALLVLLGDNRAGAAIEQIRIEPGSSQVVLLDRDAGSTIIETVELLNPLGGWERQQFVTTVPPAAFYDMSVYEEHLQSIAIDRTGKSPNQIEDVNYVPKSIGWLPLPPGAGLPAISRLDVYPRAQAANNPGAVRRLDPRQFDDRPTTNPLESILQELVPASTSANAAQTPQVLVPRGPLSNNAQASGTAPVPDPVANPKNPPNRRQF